MKFIFTCDGYLFCNVVQNRGICNSNPTNTLSSHKFTKLLRDMLTHIGIGLGIYVCTQVLLLCEVQFNFIDRLDFEIISLCVRYKCREVDLMPIIVRLTIISLQPTYRDLRTLNTT